MKKINRLAAAMAVALSMTALPQARAEIEFHPSGRGDALLFPVFNGNLENYFTIMNNHDKWIQGHLRFRGAAWSGELRDFDIILSPGDVFVFRVADVDGDGMWEIDQSLDIKNFQYTGLGGTPEKNGTDDFGVNTCHPMSNMDISYPKCMDPSDHLIPTAAELAAQMNAAKAKDPDFIKQVQSKIDYHKTMGYVEFIGEAVLDGMDYNIMQILLGNNPGAWAPYQTKVFSKRGTTAWAWSDAANKFATDRRQITAGGVPTGLSDVPNALSGTAFLTIPGVGHGLAYNAEALVNFRTGATNHRIDNYRLKCSGGQLPDAKCVLLDELNTSKTSDNRAVIVHDENASGPANASTTGKNFLPYGDYVYQNSLVEEDRGDERRISFNNTWGPTLADGDDYDLSGLRPTLPADKEIDDFDDGNFGWHGLGGGALPSVNSVAEVEEAIRLGVSKHPPAEPGPQVFSAYYMDGDIFDKSCEGNGTRRNTSFCPPIPIGQSRAKPPAGATTLTTLTSFYLAFFPTKFYYGEDPLKVGSPNYISSAIATLLLLQKPAGMEVWDIFEKSGKCGPHTTYNESVSPAVPIIHEGGPVCAFGFELTFLSINDIKNLIGVDSVVQDFVSGRVVIDIPQENNYPNLLDLANYNESWPGLMYTFEWDGGSTLAHWRPMHRMHR